MLYYLTRSLYPYDRTGGGLARYNQIQNFESNGIKVITVLPKKIQKNDARVLGYPFRGSTKLNMILQRVGIYEDYLDPWVDSAFASLSLIVKKTDVIVATSGGELGMLKLAMKLHAKIGCTYIANLHDPIDYSVINGNRIDGKFHVSRESSIKKILSSADSIVTSSEKYKKYLSSFLSGSQHIVNAYFGYTKEISLRQRVLPRNRKINIAYFGSMGVTQSPEILYDSWSKCKNKDNIKIHYVGDPTDMLRRYGSMDGAQFPGYLSGDVLHQYFMQHVDVAFLSLDSDYLGLCVPSKFFDYVNYELPLIASLPQGDVRDYIDKKELGIVCNVKDIQGLSDAIDEICIKEYYDTTVKNMRLVKSNWLFKNQQKILVNLINKYHAY